MYQGKHMKKTKKPVALLASLVMLLAVAVVGTAAFLTTNTQGVVNTFTPSSIPVEIHETFNGGTKSNVRIENEGNANAYIRAAVVVNWVDDEGNVLGQMPVENTDYSITYDLLNGWVKGSDGYYYWTKVVSPQDQDNTTYKEFTGVLVSEAKVLKGAPVSGYDLAIDIMAQSIQADGVDSATGKTPVEIAWESETTEITVGTDGVLTISEPSEP